MLIFHCVVATDVLSASDNFGWVYEVFRNALYAIGSALAHFPEPARFLGRHALKLVVFLLGVLPLRAATTKRAGVWCQTLRNPTGE